MVTIGMNYDVREGKEELFEGAFNKVIRAMRDYPGHTETRMYRDINKPRSYLIVSQWTDKKKFDEFIASDTFRNVANWGREEILTARPKHEVYGA